MSHTLKKTPTLRSSLYQSAKNSRKTVAEIVGSMIESVRDEHRDLINLLLDLNTISAPKLGKYELSVSGYKLSIPGPRLELKGLQRSMINAFVGGMILRLVKDNQNIDSQDHMLAQKMGFLNIRLIRTADDIIDDTMSDPQEKRDFIQSCFDIMQGQLSIDQLDKQDPQKLVVYYLAKEIHETIKDFKNKELFLEAYRVLIGYIFAEFDHECIPGTTNTYLQDMMHDVHKNIDETDLSPKEKISVKISTGSAMMTTLLIIVPDVIDVENETQKKSIKNMLSIGAAMQMNDDIKDREKDIEKGEISFATKADPADIGKFVEIQQKLFNIGWTGLSKYQQTLMKPLNMWFQLYTRTYGASQEKTS